MPRKTVPQSVLEIKQARLEHLRKLRAEADRQARIAAGNDVFNKLNFKPNPGPQSRFLDLPDGDLDVLYGGAVGGGKSIALLAYALRTCVRFDGVQVYWFRCTYPELDNSVMKLLRLQFAFGQALGATWVSSKYELQFPNGSILKLTHAKNEQEAISLRSAEINCLILDERTTIPPDVVDLLYTRVRSGTAGVPCLGIRSATNPGGPGHAVVLKEYIKATSHGENEIEDEYGRRRIFIQSKLTDTPQLMNDGAYLRSLQGLPEDLRAALLEGDWERFSGQMFAELSRVYHVVPPMDLPVSWRRYAGVDYGWRAPWAVLWAAVDDDGRVWIYREIYESLVRESQQAQRIIAAEGTEDVTTRFADDSMWFSRGEASTIADTYEANGCHIEKAVKGPHSRQIGFARIHDYMADAPACQYHRAQGLESCPMLHIFSTCTNLFDELKNISYAKTGNPEDSDPKDPDHAVDALRYLLLNLGNEPKWFFSEPLGVVNDHLLNRAPVVPLQEIGGHPVMPEGGDPWAHVY